MVPGVFRQVIPCFTANPLLGLTCASYPSGISIVRPVGISFRSIGFNVTASVKSARKSIPEEPFVAYSGKGLLEVFTMFTDNFDMPLKGKAPVIKGEIKKRKVDHIKVFATVL